MSFTCAGGLEAVQKDPPRGVVDVMSDSPRSMSAPPHRNDPSDVPATVAAPTVPNSKKRTLPLRELEDSPAHSPDPGDRKQPRSESQTVVDAPLAKATRGLKGRSYQGIRYGRATGRPSGPGGLDCKNSGVTASELELELKTGRKSSKTGAAFALVLNTSTACAYQ